MGTRLRCRRPMEGTASKKESLRPPRVMGVAGTLVSLVPSCMLIEIALMRDFKVLFDFREETEASEWKTDLDLSRCTSINSWGLSSG